ncbi:stalk domain-containing protein [Paenibacillus polymyxa]|nr:stalk domain-containing protein [Paenibacillus polymyxa]MCC3257503.1 copper amine oxidase N-terminal domain-containing protein [Paenibacillus polymyxa]
MIIGLVAGMLIGSATAAVAATSPTVQAVVSKYAITVDGQQQTLKSDPLVYKGTTYLPVREVAGLTGYDLQFDAKSKKIDLQSKSEGGSTVSQTTSQPTEKKVTWIPASEANEKYGIKYVMSNETTISYGENKVVFPVSMYDKKDGKTFTNAEKTASIMFKNAVTYLGSDTLQTLGITQ